MKATLIIEGFAFSPDEALSDLHERAARHVDLGWSKPSEVIVETGTNPYSEYPVHGYVARGTMTKEES